ncbi:MAG: GTPase domain-containing protein [bacterium]
MKFGKIFKFFKKGAKAASKRQAKGAPAEGGFEWPAGVRIGVYGHANCGKTVYYTVLNEDSKISRDLQISVTDGATAGVLLANFRHIWGVGTASNEGTVVDLREDKKFPVPTKGERVLQFTAVVDRKKKIKVVAYDYDGKAVAISPKHDFSEKVTDFMSGCDGIVFFYDPKMLGSEEHTQAHVASFIDFVEQLAPLHRRLPIPLALVVTKADCLPGYSPERSDKQTVLVTAEDEHFFAEDYEFFLERVLNSNRIASDSEWAASVRNVLIKLKEFLRVVVGRTLNFQIFFVSATGQEPEKIGTEVGRSLYKPPGKISPVGVRQPFYWMLKTITRNKRISILRKVAKYAAVLSLIWVAAYSLPNLYHFQYLLSTTERVEENILGAHKFMKDNLLGTERNRIKNTYDRYSRKWLVRSFYNQFHVSSNRIAELYKGLGTEAAGKRLNLVIADVRDIVGVKDSWPQRYPGGDSLVMDSAHLGIEDELAYFQKLDNTSPLYSRSGRVLIYWELFKQSILASTAAVSDSLWGQILRQIEHDRGNYGQDLSPEEKQLLDALMAEGATQEQVAVKEETVQTASSDFAGALSGYEQKMDDPKYLLVTLPTKLKKLRPNLEGGALDSANAYLSQVEYFKNSRAYTFKVVNCPPDHHIHVCVTRPGQEPDWPKAMYIAGREFRITWKNGDHILIALDKKHTDPSSETWGVSPMESEELKEPYSIFDLDATLKFNTGEVTISCQESLEEKLPKFK